ncbi:MAG: DUF4440 domain-containing protein [Rhodothermaceae bacterium]|nr:DUF4440 domain-containing protein [Rhodothermaceae bacterium]
MCQPLRFRLPMGAVVHGAFLLSICLLMACGAPAPVVAEDTSGGSYPPPAAEPVPGAAEIEAAVLAVIAFQQEAWNEGDIRSFMAGYSRSDSLVFISGGNLRRGWQANLYAYVRNYPDRSAMGTLSFEELGARALSPTLAIAYGIWRLDRAEDEPWGRFSLLFQKEDDGWRIIHDHTSSGS